MKKLNNKGFTLLEILAVVVILGILIAIMIPSVNHLIEKNKQDNYDKLIKSIQNAARIYVSDYRYDIALDNNNNCNNAGVTELKVSKISTNSLTDSKIPISILVEEGALETDKDKKISNPKNKEQTLNLTESYITVMYQCQSKDYTFSSPYLKWE